MKRRKLLQNGTKVSEVGLGCMSFAGFYGATSEAEAHRTLAAALDMGVNFLDTANIYGMGVSIGLGLSLFIVAYLEPIFGWRGCFYLLGSIGVVMAIGMLFIKETPRKHPINNEKSILHDLSATKVYKDLKILLASSQSLAATLLGTIIFTLALGAGTFEQLWFVEERGFNRNEIAQKMAGIAISAGIIGNLLGGYGGDLFLRWSGIGRPYFLALVMLLLAPFTITYRFIDPSSIFFWIGVFATYFQIGCLYGPAFGTIQDLVPSHKRGIVVGFTVLLIQIFGAALGASSAGYMIDVFISYEVSEPYSLTLVTYTVISLLSIPVFIFAGKKFENDKNRLADI